MKKTILLCAMMLTVVVNISFAKNIKTLVITTTPQMHCVSCEEKIKGNLRFEKGVKTITTNIPDQTVTIEYDTDKTTPDRLLKAFPKFGYEAQQVKKEESSNPSHELANYQ